MIPLTASWLPILISAVIVFFASFIMHMLLTYHESDYRKLPNEDRVTGARLFLSVFFVQGDEISARRRENETRPGGIIDFTAQRAARDGKKYDSFQSRAGVGGVNSCKYSASLISPLSLDTARPTSRNRFGAAEAGSLRLSVF